MRDVSCKEIESVSGAGDFYFTLRIPTDGLSNTCIDGLYTAISASSQPTSDMNVAKTLLSSCNFNDLVILTSLAGNSEHIKTEYY